MPPPQEPISFVTIPQAQFSGSPQRHASDHTQESPKHKAPIRFSSSFPVPPGQKQFTNQGSGLHNQWGIHSLVDQIAFYVGIRYRVRGLMVQILLQPGKGFVNKFTDRHILAAWSWTLNVPEFRFPHLKPILESDKKWRRLTLIKHRHWSKMFLSIKTSSITCTALNMSLNFSELDSLFVHCED